MTEATPSWSIAGEKVALEHGALVGILNVTPDSFSDGGEYRNTEAAVAHGLELVADGAVLIDVGGESTRPGALPVEESEEKKRLLPVVERLVAAGVRVSVDTYKAGVASAAIESGAVVINDVTGFRDDAMVETVSDSDCGVVIMHMEGTPIDMQDDPRYDDVVDEVETYLLSQADRLTSAGVARGRIAIDPGIGFGKTMEHNLALLNHIGRLAGHGLPVMIGTSRKGFLGRLVTDDTRAGRDRATAATTALSFDRGARLFRVHNVSGSRDALRVAGAIVTRQQWDEWLQA